MTDQMLPPGSAAAPEANPPQARSWKGCRGGALQLTSITLQQGLEGGGIPSGSQARGRGRQHGKTLVQATHLYSKVAWARGSLCSLPSAAGMTISKNTPSHGPLLHDPLVIKCRDPHLHPLQYLSLTLEGACLRE
jgi:hypothetical protein